MESWPRMHRALNSVPKTAKEVLTAKSCQSPHFPGEKTRCRKCRLPQCDGSSPGLPGCIRNLLGDTPLDVSVRVSPERNLR